MDKWLKENVVDPNLTDNTDDPIPVPMTSTSPDENKKSRKNIRKFCSKWLEKEEFAKWLVHKTDKGKDFAYCNVCNSSMSAHLTEIKRHGSSPKHITNSKQVDQQKSVSEVFKLSSLTEKTRIAEIKMAAFLATKNLPLSVTDELIPLCKSIFHDSKIVKNMSLARTKTTAVMQNVLGKNLLNELCDTLKMPGTFYSLIMDETTDIAEIKQCTIIVIYFDTQTMMVKTRFLDMVETSSGTADHLTKLLLECLHDKGIPKDMFVGFSSDTTNAMAGSIHSVFTNLKIAIPDIACVKCSCHMIHLSSSKACLKLPRSIEDLLRNIGSHFSRSHSRQTKYKEFQEFFHVEIHKILSPATTRWLSLKACVDRVLQQFPALKEYFRLASFEDPSKTIEQIHVTMDNCFTVIYLEFMSYNTLGLLTNFNTLFQSEGPLLHLLKPETEKLLKTIVMNYMDIEYIRSLDSIMTVSPKNIQYYIPITDIYIGVNATASILNLKSNKSVDSNEIIKLFKSCQEFYIELVVDIKKRFIFDDPVFKCIAISDPATVK